MTVRIRVSSGFWERERETYYAMGVGAICVVFIYTSVAEAAGKGNLGGGH
jgi:hypothetical protein